MKFEIPIQSLINCSMPYINNTHSQHWPPVTRPDFATSSDSKISDSPVHTVPNCLRIQKFPLWRADSKSCKFACEFAGYVWTKGESGNKKLRIQKYPDTCGRDLKGVHSIVKVFKGTHKGFIEAVLLLSLDLAIVDRLFLHTYFLILCQLTK